MTYDRTRRFLPQPDSHTNLRQLVNLLITSVEIFSRHLHLLPELGRGFERWLGWRLLKVPFIYPA